MSKLSSDKIRDSLNHDTYIGYARSLKIAADENLDLFISFEPEFHENHESRLKSSGLFRSSMLLYAVSVELILKASALYKEQSKIQKGEIKTFNDFMKIWQGNSDGHDYNRIIDHYEIKLTERESQILKELQHYTSWAGRFPYPKKEEQIKKFENANKRPGKLSSTYKEEVEDFINKRIAEMN